MRVYTDVEREVLGDDSIAFISFLESAGVLPPADARDGDRPRHGAVGSGPWTWTT
jgi:Smg protein